MTSQRIPSCRPTTNVGSSYARTAAPASKSAERSSLRELIPSLPNTLRRCHSTVRGLRNSWAPISGFVCPSAASRAICDLLRRQVVERLDGALAHRLAGGQQLAAGALGERLHAHLGEHRVRDAQLLAGVDAAVLAPQPFAVERGARGPASRRGCGCATAVRSPPGRAARRPLPRPASPRARAWIPSAQSVPLACAISASWASGPAARSGLPLRDGGLDELGQHPDRRPQPARGPRRPARPRPGRPRSGRARCSGSRCPSRWRLSQSPSPRRSTSCRRASISAAPRRPVPRQFASAMRGAQGQVAAGGLDDGVRLGGQRRRHRRSCRRTARRRTRSSSATGSSGERAGPARELELARGELVPRLVVAQRRGRCGRPATASAARPPRRAARRGTRAARPSTPAPRAA